MRNSNGVGLSLVLMGALMLPAGISCAAAKDDSAALKQEITALKARINELEGQLAQKHKTTNVQADSSDEYFDPFDQMDLMQRSISQMFNDSLGRRGMMSMDAFNPQTDIKQTDKEYHITMDIPGMEKEKIDVKVEGKNLIVSGERSSESESTTPSKMYRHERSFGRFMRVVPLPADALADKIDAAYNNGVLTIKLERKPVEKPVSQKVQVK